MHTVSGITARDVQDVYNGPEGDLWELVMGEQIHIGGLKSSTDLAERAAIAPGSKGVDLCCCSGAGMRFLIRFARVAAVTGVDFTTTVIERGRQRTEAEGLSDRITFVQADATATGLPDGEADFIWGEDAWCYVEDKAALMAEAARLVKSEGTIAFTDWVEGPAGLTEVEAERLLKFMKFPGIQSLDGYAKLLEENQCVVQVCEDTGRFPPAVDLYLNMLDNQLTYDALRIIGFDMKMMQGLAAEMQFMRELAYARKLVQGVFVAVRR